MNRRCWVRWWDSVSENRKSKTCPFDMLRASSEPRRRIQNRKWVGTVALVVAFAACGAVAQAQQPKKIPRIGHLSNIDPARDSVCYDAIRLVLHARWGERLSTHPLRSKIFSSAAQISGIYTVATSQTMCKSTLA